jgi:hypothetical protein
MYKPHHSHRGSALIVWLIIVVLLTVLTTSFLEKILSLGKVSGGIGNSAQAYTLATGIIEEQLMDSAMTKETPWNIATRSEWSTTNTWRSLTAATGGTMIPAIWKWNSSFDSDWNIISLGEPVQIVIDSSVNWNNVDFYFRVPTIPGESTNTGSNNTWGIILWTFGYSGASLYASGETNIFNMKDDIKNIPRKIDGYNGQTNTGTLATFNQFWGSTIYWVWSNGAKCAWFQCTLKLSMIRPFLTDLWKTYSFLEYKIDFSTATSLSIPSQYMVIDSSAYVYGYLRSRQVRIPQITSNTATDFAVLQ